MPSVPFHVVTRTAVGRSESVKGLSAVLRNEKQLTASGIDFNPRASNISRCHTEARAQSAILRTPSPAWPTLPILDLGGIGSLGAVRVDA